MSRLACGVLIVSVLVSGRARAADATAEDLARMQGDWMVAAMWSGGIKVPDDEAQALFRTVEGNRYTVSRYSKPSSTGTFQIDATASPKTIDSTPEVAKDKPPILGIYEFDGQTLRIANAQPGQPRPTTFKPRIGHTVIEWQLEAM